MKHRSLLLEATRVAEAASARTRFWRRETGPSFQRLEDGEIDRRLAPRRAARLKWGKTLDDRDRFLCDCVIADRTESGARLRLARNLVLPATFQLFDETNDAIYASRVVWRRGVEIGCRLSCAPTSGKTQIVRRMTSRHYAI